MSGVERDVPRHGDEAEVIHIGQKCRHFTPNTGRVFYLCSEFTECTVQESCHVPCILLEIIQ